MRKLFSVVLCLCLCVGLSACQDDNRNYVSDHDEGYYAGYEDGLWDGAFECKKDFANAVRDRYFDVEGETSKEKGLHPEEAIIILRDYLDGDYVSDDELRTAMRSIAYFYSEWQSVIANIEDMEVDIYFD